MTENLQLFILIIGLLGTVGTFLIFHFGAIRRAEKRYEEKLEHEKERIRQLELAMKELEKRDALQQQTLDSLNNLYPSLQKAFAKILREEEAK